MLCPIYINPVLIIDNRLLVILPNNLYKLLVWWYENVFHSKNNWKMATYLKTWDVKCVQPIWPFCWYVPMWMLKQSLQELII